MFRKFFIAAALAMVALPAAAQLVDPPTRVQYAVADEQPASAASTWKEIELNPLTGEAEIPGVPKLKRFWIRAETGDVEPSWAVYGPLAGGDQQLDIIPVDQEGENPTVQFQGAKLSVVEKGLKCCKVRVKVRVRVVTKKPSVTVKAPSVTVRWRGPIPQVTVEGPEVTIKDLPTIKVPDVIPESGSVPNAGMRCEVTNGEAKLWVQNGDPNPIDVWVNWKGTTVGPIRIEAKTQRSLGGTAYPDCKTAQDNIYITKAEPAN